MAVIQTYNDSFTAQGQVTSQASGADFGSQVGAALGQVGEGIKSVADAMYQNEVTDDVTQAHVEMAKARAQWQQELQNREMNATPGDQTFAPKLMEDMGKSFQDMGQQFKTRQGQETFARMSADMTAMFGQEAIGIQGRLAGQAAKNQYTTLSNSLGTVAAQDHTQWEGLVKQGLAAIDDPNGIFARVPQTTRDELKTQLKDSIMYDAAKGFARRYPNAVLGTVPPELRTGVQQAIANPAAASPGQVPNLNASNVKPYDDNKISYIAKVVAAPSPYDALFTQAAAMYGIDPRELKLRAAAESNLNAAAVSSQGAQGIMQMTPDTAKQLGVDPNDPKAAIFGAAKLLAQYRTAANGDMSKVDMMYYGGASGTAWGANTKQYAANMAAARNAVGLGSQVDPASFAPTPAEQAGAAQDWKKPSTGIGFIDQLSPEKFFNVLTEAEHYQRAYDSQAERDRMEQSRLKKEAQDKVMDTMLRKVIDPANNGGTVSEQDITQDATLSWEQKQHMVDYKMRREREQAAAQEPKSNPTEVRRLMLEIHAADDDPRKTYNMDPIMDSYKAGNISTPEMMTLRREVEQLRDGNTSGFQKDVQNARNAVFTSLSRSILGQVQPEVAADAAYRFNQDMEQQIAALRKQNKDPRVLLDPNSREYLLKPERIQSFMPHKAAAANQQAGQVAAAQAPSIPTYKDYDKLPAGTTYTDPQGNVRVKK